MLEQTKAVSPNGTSEAPACEVTASTEPPDWADYLASNAASTIFHDARWGAMMRSAYGNAPYYLTARRGDRTVGVLQLVAKKSATWSARYLQLSLDPL